MKSFNHRMAKSIVTDTLRMASESLALDYDGSHLIGDIIPEVADRYAPTKKLELYASCEALTESIQEVLRDGYPIDPLNFKSVDLIRAGYVRYIENFLYDNMQEIFLKRYQETAGADPRLRDDPFVPNILKNTAAKVHATMTFDEVDELYRRTVAPCIKGR